MQHQRLNRVPNANNFWSSWARLSVATFHDCRPGALLQLCWTWRSNWPILLKLKINIDKAEY